MKRNVFYTVIAALLAGVCLFLTALNIAFPFSYRNEIKSSARRFGLSEELVFGVVWTESKFDAKAVSRAGAAGLMQLMPATAEFMAQRLGITLTEESLFRPAVNVTLGCAYLKYLSEKFTGERLVLAAYNAGEGAVSEWIAAGLKEFPYSETRDYVARVNFAKNVYSYRRTFSELN